MSGILSVSSLNELAKQLLESNLSAVRVQGEVRSFVKAASGHQYFTLKDDGAEVRCALFRGQVLRVKAAFANGDAVVVGGSVSLYAPRGDYQLIVSTVELAGDGQLAAVFEALKKKLFAEGLFDVARKRPLPVLPRHIVVISSAVGAAIADVLAVLARRLPLARITLFATAVQGEAAAGELTRAVQRITPESGFDVALIVRGGGSMSDLWAFNDEVLARAIIACPIPVVSGVGHEIDFTISDFVADVRAATPTAAAELATAVTMIDMQHRLTQRFERLTRVMVGQLNLIGQRLDQATSRLQHIGLQTGHSQRLALELRLTRALRRQWQSKAAPLADLTQRLARVSPARWQQTKQNYLAEVRRRLQIVYGETLRQHRRHLAGLSQSLQPNQARNHLISRQQTLMRARQNLYRAALQQQQIQNHRLNTAQNVLQALSPQRVLERGYSLVECAQGVLTKSTDLTAALAQSPAPIALTLHFADGKIGIHATKRI
jgi:exodeoxyribonuclease VII large subunit